MADGKRLRMPDDEALRVAIFQLESCSKSMLERAEQTESTSLRHALVRLPRTLMQQPMNVTKAAQDEAAEE